MRRFAEEYELVIVNTFSGYQDTFFGVIDGIKYSSRPDYILVPIGMFMSSNARCCVFKRSADVLQLANATFSVDHRPLALMHDTRTLVYAGSQREPWDRDRMLD